MQREWIVGFGLLLLSLAAPFAGATTKGADRHEQGRAIYNFRCYFCHGYSGDARTLTATYLDPRPRDFTALRENPPSRERMLAAVRDGIPGTAMAGFANILDAQAIALVVDFVRREFIEQGLPNTRYHTAANGWPDHDRYRDAFPFATGEVPLDTPWETLDAAGRRGKRLFLSTCISCHDRAHVRDEGPVWEAVAVSYPRKNTCCNVPPPDSISGASVFARHDVPPRLPDLDPEQRRGEALYQANCAFCHAADGTGRNWIGSFLEPRPRDLTDPGFMRTLTPQRLRQIIETGIPGTTMPAWRDVLEETDITAIIRYIDRAFHPLARDRADGTETGDDSAPL